MKRFGSLTTVIGAVAALAVLAAAVVLFLPGGETKYVVADFPRTVSLYKGSDVKILGVAVGKVESVVPAGTKVRVKMSYDGKYKVPADAKAAVVSPSIVGDRFVQLTPAWRRGATLPDNAHLGIERTATPLELDEIFGSLNDLNIALGPNGANKADASGIGPLTRLLDSTARNFGGQGVEFNKTLKDLGKFTETLADNKEELFGTLAQVEQFTSTLAKNDQTVRSFNDSLASGANLLADEREDLAAALRHLSVALTQIKGFVRENRNALGSNISGLTQLSRTLVKQRAAIDEILKVAPTALNNLSLAYNENTGTLDTRDNVGELGAQLQADPAALLCGFLSQAPGGAQACKTIQGLKLHRAGALSTDRSQEVHVVEPIDRTMGGLLEVDR